MSKRVIDRYCRAVGRQLICLRETRQELIGGLRQELLELPPEQSESFAKLKAHYGKMSQTAVELQEAVSPGEREIALKRQRRKYLIMGLAAAVVIGLLTVLVILLSRNMDSTIVVYPPNVVPPDTLQ